MLWKSDNLPCGTLRCLVKSTVSLNYDRERMPIITIRLHDQALTVEYKVRLPSSKHGLMHNKTQVSIVESISQHFLNSGHLFGRVLTQSCLPTTLTGFIRKLAYCAQRVHLRLLNRYTAFIRAVLLRTLTSALRWRTAFSACTGNRFAPTRFLLTFLRAKYLGLFSLTTVCRKVTFPTENTYTRGLAFHVLMLPRGLPV